LPVSVSRSLKPMVGTVKKTTPQPAMTFATPCRDGFLLFQVVNAVRVKASAPR
jgi:hypothetical protein